MIHRFLDGALYDPHEVSLLTDMYERLSARLRLARDDERERLARIFLRLANSATDSDSLAEQALKQFRSASAA